MKKERYGLPWFMVIVLSALFFPIGVPMGIYKGLKEKLRYKGNAKPLLITGFISIIFILAGVSACVSTPENSANYYVTAGFISITATFLPIGFYVNAKGNLYIKYTRTLTGMAQSFSENSVKIGTVASHVKDSPEKAERVIREMLAADCLRGFRLDSQKKQIIWGSPAMPPPQAAVQNPAPAPEYIHITLGGAPRQTVVRKTAPDPVQAPKTPVSVVCERCGGVNKAIPGSHAVCQYCECLLH